MAGMLTGKVVTLRRVEPADYPLILGWQNDPEVFRWMDYERPFSFHDIVESEELAAREGHPFVIESGSMAVGRVGLNRLRLRDRIAALYLFVGERDTWGKGVGRDAVMVLLRYAFD